MKLSSFFTLLACLVALSSAAPIPGPSRDAPSGGTHRNTNNGTARDEKPAATLSAPSAAHHQAPAGSHQGTVVYRPAPERQAEHRHTHNRRGAPHGVSFGGAHRNANEGHGTVRDDKPPTMLYFHPTPHHNTNAPAVRGNVRDEKPPAMPWPPAAPHHHAPASSH